jgi:hypothetical protein
MTASLKSRGARPKKPVPGPPDLQTQLEALLDTVWSAEANWRLDDRIDLAVGKRRNRRT